MPLELKRNPLLIKAVIYKWKEDWCVRPTLYDNRQSNLHECVKMNVSSKSDLPKHANIIWKKGGWVVEFSILLSNLNIAKVIEMWMEKDDAGFILFQNASSNVH